jgi:membrane protein
VFVGALITALLFTLGKFGIGYYLSKSNLATVFGAAGSVIIIMIWVYYSSAILDLGAVLTKVYATNPGSKIFPNDYSMWIRVEEVPVPEVTLNKLK